VAAAVQARIPEAKLPVTPGRGPNYRPNPSMVIDRITADTGYRPQFTLEQSVDDFLAWLQTHPQ
jgi:nucleoside-diphosphate-sugar epimerase